MLDEFWSTSGDAVAVGEEKGVEYATGVSAEDRYIYFAKFLVPTSLVVGIAQDHPLRYLYNCQY
jgi:hypothetical protein